MKRNYDFSKGERGKFYRPDMKLNIPIYLDEEVSAFVDKLASKKRVDRSSVVNDLLRDEIKLAEQRDGGVTH
jgi:predicted transcriptional regulator